MEFAIDDAFYYAADLNELKESGFDLNYLEPLFIKQKMFKEHEVITKDTDLEIVSMYNQDFGSEAANQYAAMSIDFYYIERYLRTRRHGAFPVYSSIPKELFERHHSVDALIRHSDYYKRLAGINVRNFEAKFDAVMIETMKQYFHEARGVNGIFAKVYFKVLDLRNIRIVLKGHLYGMEIKGIVRDVNG